MSNFVEESRHYPYDSSGKFARHVAKHVFSEFPGLHKPGVLTYGLIYNNQQDRIRFYWQFRCDNGHTVRVGDYQCEFHLDYARSYMRHENTRITDTNQAMQILRDAIQKSKTQWERNK